MNSIDISLIILFVLRVYNDMEIMICMKFLFYFIA